MLTRIFLLLCTYEVAQGSLKTYCLKSDKCDDTWRPEDLDNIDAALVGYDLPSGNFKKFHNNKLFTICIINCLFTFLFFRKSFFIRFHRRPWSPKANFQCNNSLRRWRVCLHSSEILGLCLMKWPSKMLQNLPHFWNMKTHVVFSFCGSFFPNKCPGLCWLYQGIYSLGKN